MPFGSVGSTATTSSSMRSHDVGRRLDDVGSLPDRSVGGRRRRSAGSRRARAARRSPTWQISSARSAHARSSMRFTASFDAKNSAQVQNDREHGDQHGEPEPDAERPCRRFVEAVVDVAIRGRTCGPSTSTLRRRPLHRVDRVDLDAVRERALDDDVRVAVGHRRPGRHDGRPRRRSRRVGPRRR